MTSSGEELAILPQPLTFAARSGYARLRSVALAVSGQAIEREPRAPLLLETQPVKLELVEVDSSENEYLDSLDQSRKPDLFFGQNAVIPKARIEQFERDREKGRYDITLRLSGQDPRLTAKKAVETTKEKILLARDFLSTVLEKAQVKLKKVETFGSDKATQNAILYACGAFIIQTSNNGELRGLNLERKIHETAPGILENETLRSTLRHYNADPREYIERLESYRGNEYFRAIADHPAGSSFLASFGTELTKGEQSNA